MSKQKEETPEWKQITGFAILVVVCLVAVIAFFSAWYSVPEGSYGCVFNRFSGWDFTEKTEGLHFKIPIVEKVHKIPFRTQTLGVHKDGTGENAVLVPKDRNGINFNIDVTVRYRIDGNQACEFIQQKGKTVEPVLLTAMRADSTRGVFGQYAQEEIPQKRIEIATQVRDKLQERLRQEASGQLKSDFILVEAVDLRNVEYAPRIEEAIIGKQERKQEAEKQEYILDQAQKEKEIKIVQAEASKESAILEAQGLGQAIVIEAEARARGIEVVNDAYQGMPPQYVEVKYAEALKEIAQGDNSVFMDLGRFQGGNNVGFLDYNQLMSLPAVRERASTVSSYGGSTAPTNETGE